MRWFTLLAVTSVSFAAPHVPNPAITNHGGHQTATPLPPGAYTIPMSTHTRPAITNHGGHQSARRGVPR